MIGVITTQLSCGTTLKLQKMTQHQNIRVCNIQFTQQTEVQYLLQLRFQNQQPECHSCSQVWRFATFYESHSKKYLAVTIKEAHITPATACFLPALWMLLVLTTLPIENYDARVKTTLGLQLLLSLFYSALLQEFLEIHRQLLYYTVIHKIYV